MKSKAFEEQPLGKYDDNGLEVYGTYAVEELEDCEIISTDWTLKAVEECPGLEVWGFNNSTYTVFFVSMYHGVVLSTNDKFKTSSVMVNDLCKGHLMRDAIQRVLKKIAKLHGKKAVSDQLRGANNTVDSWIGGMKLVECLTRSKTSISRAGDVHPKIIDIILQEIYSQE